MGENLIQGDLPIIEFRKKREEMLKANEAQHNEKKQANMSIKEDI
jgi:hypothetical protein